MKLLRMHKFITISITVRLWIKFVQIPLKKKDAALRYVNYMFFVWMMVATKGSA